VAETEPESEEQALVRLQVLEDDVREAEQRLAALQASQRAMSTEVEAAQDLRQFDARALVPDGAGRAGRRLGHAAVGGLLSGIATGTAVAIAVHFLLVLAR
jgi:hypothetical protein